MKRLLLLFLLVYATGVCYSQSSHLGGVWGSHLATANKLYSEKLYEEAIIHYQKELERNEYSEIVVSQLAESYTHLGNYKKADDYYTLLFAAQKDVDNTEYMYNYAEALTSTGRYDKARLWYSNYLSYVPDDQHAINKLNALDNIHKYYTDSSRYEIASMPFNTSKTELGGVPYKNGLIFSSARDQDLIIRYDHLREIESLLDLYFYDPSDSSVVHYKLPKHGKSNDGPIAISGDQFIVTRNVGYNKHTEQNVLGLFFFKETDKGMKQVEAFKFNNPSYSVTHPSISKTQDTLFFTSNMPGGFGKRDIYFSVKVNGEWQSPLNMGNIVNTPRDDVFPYSYNGRFYFSSNGHPGLGGLDVFELRSGYEIKNVGAPINSGWDDFSFSISDNKGYFSSNRPETIGHDDIFSFTYTPFVKPPHAVLRVIVFDSLANRPVLSSEVEFMNSSEDIPVYHKHYNGSGIYEYQVDRLTYDISVSSPGFETKRTSIDLNGLDQETVIIKLMADIKLEKLNLDSILFDYDDHALSKSAVVELEHIVELMNKYNTLQLEISAHTDSRGEAEYNLSLSELRATSTATHLINQGISESRMTTNGYGETMLLNRCSDGVKCSDEEHSVNRRIEFKLTQAKKP